MAKPSDPIVILHSSCRDDVADPTKKTSESSSTTTTAVDEDEDILASLPISCDVLIMPEIPGDHNSQIEPNGYHPPELLELLENQFNPCGVSNVLLLENFPWRNVLLSLTSCNIKYDNVSLPVEPIPSTFDFSFPEGMRNYQTTQQELALEFDLSMARSQLLEGQQQALLVEQRLEEESKRGGLLTTKVIEALLPSPGSISQELPTINTHDEKLTSASSTTTKDKKRNDSECPFAPDMRLVDSFYTEMCIAPLQERRSHVRSQHEQRLVISQLQAMMEKETNELDRMISVLAVVGLFLLLLLAWSGYQLYRSTKREEQMEETRESVRTKILTKIVGASAMSLGPLALDSLVKKAESPPSIIRVEKQWASDDSSKSKLLPKLLEESFEWWDSDDSGDIQLSPKFMEESSEQKRLVSNDEPKEWHVGETTPRVSNRCAARPRASQIPAQVTPPREQPLRALPTQPNNGNDDHYVASPTRDAQIFAPVTPPREHHVNVFPAQPHSVKVELCKRKECPKERKIPQQATRSPEPPMHVLPTQSQGCKLGRSEVQGSIVNTDGQILTANAPEKKCLSPCSKLAQEWAEKKTARRSNRRKNRQKLEPLFVKSTGNHDAGEQPVKNFLISRHPTDESRSSSRLLGPPTLRSITKGRDFEAHLNSRQNRPVSTDRPADLKLSPFKTSTFSTEEEEDPFVSKERADPGKRHFLTPDFSRSSESPACGPTLPELCSTPGSEDSFVDDYW
jgi:hypothetical protein